MLTFNDLKNIDSYLMRQQAVVNQSPESKDLIEDLRNKIANTMNEIEVKVSTS